LIDHKSFKAPRTLPHSFFWNPGRSIIDHKVQHNHEDGDETMILIILITKFYLIVDDDDDDDDTICE